MTSQTEIFKSVLALTGFPVDIGECQQESGYCARLVRGIINKTFPEESALQIMPVQFMGRSSDQLSVIDGLFSICNTLTQKQSYPTGAGWEITSISLEKTPAFVKKQDDEKWVYSCILYVKFYLI